MHIVTEIMGEERFKQDGKMDGKQAYRQAVKRDRFTGK